MLILTNSIYSVRLIVSSILFTVFGYVSPVLNSIKAIVNKDVDGTKEYVTYWVVLSTLMYCETLLSAVNYFRNYPPELKVAYVLWLTLPRFQGAYRIYTVLFQPYFEKYENDIDRKVEEFAGQVKISASRKMKTILWQLFLAPNDGLICGLGSMLATIDLNSKLMFVQNLHSIANSVDNLSLNSDELDANKCRPVTPTRPLTIQEQVLQEFTKMLMGEGIYVFAGSNPILMFPCQLSLCIGEDKVIQVSSVEDQNPSTIISFAKISVSLIRIVSAELISSPLPSDCHDAGSEVDVALIKIKTEDQAIFYLREEEQEGGETEALLAGLMILISDAKISREMHESKRVPNDSCASQLKLCINASEVIDEAKENCANMLSY